MIVEGMLLGTITMTGFAFTYKKLPGRVKRFIVRHPLLTEVVMVVTFYEIMGMTVIAHVAAAVMTLQAMALLHIARNPDDFRFLDDVIDEGKAKMRAAMDKLKEINARHMARKQLAK